MRDYCVYIMANKSRMIYVGVTNNLERRVQEHKSGQMPGFTQHYSLDRLVYVEVTDDVRSAIEREKQIKGWVRRKKVALIHLMNPGWEDLSVEWMPQIPDTGSLRSR